MLDSFQYSARYFFDMFIYTFFLEEPILFILTTTYYNELIKWLVITIYSFPIKDSS
jgi:hypothetical protein